MCETAQAQESFGGSIARESADWDGPRQVGDPDGGLCHTERTARRQVGCSPMSRCVVVAGSIVLHGMCGTPLMHRYAAFTAREGQGR